MGYPTKVQLIRRKKSSQWYIGFPSALAAALGFEKGEIVEWRIQDRSTLILTRIGARDGRRHRVTTTMLKTNEVTDVTD